MEHFYQSIDGWFDFADIYVEAVSEARDGARFVEVGTWLGRSTAFLAVEIRRSGKKISLHCVDTFSGTPDTPCHASVVQAHGGRIRAAFDAAMERGGVSDVVEVIEADSAVAADSFAHESLDFVFIDADHSYEAVRRDIEAWAPKVRAGGVLAGHDYSVDFPGVIRAVTEYLSKYDAERKIRGRSWWFRKPSMNFTVAVTTAPREPAYLESTMAGIVRGTAIVALPGPVRVCVSGDTSTAERMRRLLTAPASVRFEPAIADAWQIVREDGPHRRCCANTWQALAMAPPDRDVLLLQDDVELAEAGPLHLRFRLRLAQQSHGERFVLALYASYRFSGEQLAHYPTQKFYGNQALYFPACVASEYAARLWEHVRDYQLPDDMVLKGYAVEAGVPLLVSLPNLAQHVGRNSTGLGDFHESPTYCRSP